MRSPFVMWHHVVAHAQSLLPFLCIVPLIIQCFPQDVAPEMLEGFDHVGDPYSASLNTSMFSAHPSEMKPVSTAAASLALLDVPGNLR